eukprot:CAMPEP_0196789630 /NCGR_PEP_ID=MMETSP1104-20130614/26880_1 /TAXON_ID=33652 /ORGANISM="Cafeteria sp., Strain Caron Lab Isolate" /LENGTH=111 /DNA_ID=CAMNT_0042159993 /DNA_START=1 /DNA_END=332 /DNA_ORIENTATION=+
MSETMDDRVVLGQEGAEKPQEEAQEAEYVEVDDGKEEDEDAASTQLPAMARVLGAYPNRVSEARMTIVNSRRRQVAAERAEERRARALAVLGGLPLRSDPRADGALSPETR